MKGSEGLIYLDIMLNQVDFMKFWIEVSTGDQAWTRKLISNPEQRRGLKAPASTRHKNILMPVRAGDIVLSHLTVEGTRTKKWKGAIVGISSVEEECRINGNSLTVKLSDTKELIVPIKFSEYKQDESFSKIFRKAISYKLQKYLIEITKDDFLKLMKTHTENLIILEKTNFAEIFEEVEQNST